MLRLPNITCRTVFLESDKRRTRYLRVMFSRRPFVYIAWARIYSGKQGFGEDGRNRIINPRDERTANLHGFDPHSEF